jgi:hypothetical protein
MPQIVGMEKEEEKKPVSVNGGCVCGDIRD